jgi:Protein of unknown function (DUF1573)
MKILILLLLIFIPLPAVAGPSIVFLAEQHDFGTVRQGEKLEYTFEFTNAGMDELVVSQVTTFT